MNCNLSPLLNSFLMKMLKIQKKEWCLCPFVCVCVCVSNEGHVSYLSTDVPCQCQTETFYLPNKAVLPHESHFVTLS